MNMIKLTIVAIICAFVSACSSMSALDAINPFKDDKGIDATVQLGKENTSIDNKAIAQVEAKSNTNVSSNNDIRADKVEQNAFYKDSPWLIIAFALMAGFAIPNPFNYYAHRRQIKDLKEIADEREQRLRAIYERLRESREARQSERASAKDTPDN